MADAKAELVAALDLNRFAELRKQADLAQNLWASLLLAAERGDTANINYLARHIAPLTRSALVLVKTLGSEEVDNG